MKRVAVALIVGALALLAARERPAPALLGFVASATAAQRDLERRFLAFPSADRIREVHRFLTDKPHMAGSPRDRELAEWTRDRFREFGLEEVAITTHEVLLPWPEELVIETIAPAGPRGVASWRASMREDPVPTDSFTDAPPAAIGLPYHAFSASGEVTAPAIYAGHGNPSDFDWLADHGIDVRGRIALVRHSAPYSYRGAKALTAQQRGAAGILIYSDPADDGSARGAVYPDGPWGPDSHLQRGAIAYDFLAPGDPLTPGWASTAGAPRIELSAASLPRIISAPLSPRDARVILESLGGPEVPASWRGALPIAYRAGPGTALVRVRVRNDDRVRPVWTVTGLIRGRERPEEVVIVGNHRDAWIYGGVDPSSGSAALVELARGVGELARSGWRPRRSILFASWDAEEFSLASSTEWGEQHEGWLRASAVAYLNVDSAVSGPDFSASAVPALNALIDEVALTVRDPASGLTLAARARDRLAGEQGARLSGSPGDFVNNRLGGGSDYTVFLNFLGVPVADFSFQGPFGVYHSVYDTHDWVARFGDPGFRYHAAMVQFWGLLALKLANADLLPLDYQPYAARIDEFAIEISRRWTNSRTSSDTEPFAEVRQAATAMGAAAARLNDRRRVALERSDRAEMVRINTQLLAVERTLTDLDGIPGRPWYRHLVYAPAFTYAPELLPGLAEAVAAGDERGARRQAQRLAAALRRAAAALEPR
jgi:N-acetylated-alpha-linked acidic dipeptidase